MLYASKASGPAYFYITYHTIYEFLPKKHFREVMFCFTKTLIIQDRVHISSKFKNHNKLDIPPHLLV